MKRFLSNVLLCLSVCGLLFSGKELWKIYQEYNTGKKIYKKLEEDVEIKKGETKDGEDTLSLSVNFDKLKKVNRNCIGWIYIPNTNINYPIVQATDNQYELKHAFDGTYNINGSIFVSDDNHGFLDRNTIIYGHHMKNEAMFSDLHKYMDGTFAKENPYIYIQTEDGLQTYQIFSAYKTTDGSSTYTTIFTDDAFLSYIKKAESMSEIEIPHINITSSDQILTLSTCMSRGVQLERFVVQAVRT